MFNQNLFLLSADINNLFASVEKSVLENVKNYYDMGLALTEVVLKEPSVQELMASNQTFDAVLCEVFLSEALFGLSEHFKAPLVGLSTFGAASWNTDLVSEQYNTFNANINLFNNIFT